MKSHNYSKIILAGLLVVLIGGITAAVVLRDDAGNTADGTSKTNQTKATPTAVPNEPDIVLQNLGLKRIDASTNYTRFAVQDYATNGMKGFYLFGDKLPGNRVNPNFEYASIKSNAHVVAAIDGIVTFIREQPETKDYEVFIQPSEGSAWTIGYDHLIDVKVSVGQRVQAGDNIGNAAVQNNGLYRFEMQINKDVAGVTTHYCPSALLSQEVSVLTQADLAQSLQSWEEEAKNQELYDTTKQKPIGCLKPTLTVAEAEGR